MIRFKEGVKSTFDLIAAYCLMPNHYHMLVQTPEANISRSMRHLNGVYKQRYNRRHKCAGQLFRGRYKSLLIDTDWHLLQAVRYIRRNPLHADLVQNLDAYNWSSHKGFIGVRYEYI